MSTTSIAPMESRTAEEALSPLLATCVAFLILNTLFFSARFFTSIFLRRSKANLLWWDDYFMIPAFVINIGLIIIAFEMRKIYVEAVPSYTAHQQVDPIHHPIEYPTLVALLKCVYAMTNLLIPAFVFNRLSIVALFLRIFNGRFIRTACYGLMVLFVLQWIPSQIVALLLCNPVHKFWDRFPPGGATCVDANKFLRAISYPTLVLDLGLIALPIPSILRLQISMSRKIALACLFSTSLLAFIGSAYRTHIVQTNDSSDLSPEATNLWICWIVGETGMYLIVACLPALAPLVRFLLPHRVSKHMPPAGGRRYPQGDFTRLVESDAVAHQAKAGRGGEKEPKGNAIEMDERGARAEHMKAMQDGMNVLVHTEIMVTEEEKIADVIGI